MAFTAVASAKGLTNDSVTLFDFSESVVDVSDSSRDDSRSSECGNECVRDPAHNDSTSNTLTRPTVTGPAARLAHRPLAHRRYATTRPRSAWLQSFRPMRPSSVTAGVQYLIPLIDFTPTAANTSGLSPATGSTL